MPWPVTITLPDGATIPGELHEQRESRNSDRWWCHVRARVWGSEIGDYIDSRMMWVPAAHVQRVEGVDYTGVPTRRLTPQQRDKARWNREE